MKHDSMYDNLNSCRECGNPVGSYYCECHPELKPLTMSYTVLQITQLTPTHIHALLTDDLPVEIDRQAFEDYITEGTGKYQYIIDHYEPVTGHREQEITITLDEYWDGWQGSTAIVAHVTDYIEQCSHTQLSIALQRAYLNIKEACEHHAGFWTIMEPKLVAYTAAIVNKVNYEVK